MSAQRYLEPQALNYVAQSGGFRSTESEVSAVLFLLKTQRGSCLVAPDAGNRLAAASIITPENSRQYSFAVEEALAPLTSTGRIWALEINIETEGSARGGTISFADAAGRQSVGF